MESELIYIFIFLGVLSLINIVATFVVLKTHFEIKERRVYQILFIWFIPIMGAFTTIYINKEDYFHSKHLDKVGNNPGQTYD